jgi:1,4-alpha-glucan branching enzyme
MRSGNGIYFYEDGRAESPWGPRWNYDDANVKQYIIDNVRMWLTEYRLSGFRWDSTV